MKRKKVNHWLLIIVLISALGCGNDSCGKEISDYFEVKGMNTYASKLIAVVTYDDRETYTKTVKIDSTEQNNLKMVVEIDVSRFGTPGDDCVAFYGDLGAEERTTEIKIVDLISSTNLTSECYLSEVEMFNNLEYEDSFTVYYNYYEQGDIINTSIDSLNTIDYRMSLHNFVIGFKNQLNKGDYTLEITHALESKTFVNEVSFEIE